MHQDERRDPGIDLSGKHVLLVDDSEINRELSSELLASVGVRVTTAENGLEALEKLERNVFDLVLMDCEMPVMDGHEAARLIRSDPRWSKLPVIAFSSACTADDRKKALEVGMNDFIAKPVDPKNLFDTVRRWIAVSNA